MLKNQLRAISEALPSKLQEHRIIKRKESLLGRLENLLIDLKIFEYYKKYFVINNKERNAEE